MTFVLVFFVVEAMQLLKMATLLPGQFRRDHPSSQIKTHFHREGGLQITSILHNTVIARVYIHVYVGLHVYAFALLKKIATSPSDHVDRYQESVSSRTHRRFEQIINLYPMFVESNNQ